MGATVKVWIRAGAAAALLAAPAAPIAASEPGGVCLGERATIVGSDDPDRIEGTDRKDVILALGGDDVILGDDGADRICGGPGDDHVDGRYGDDSIHASDGEDVLEGGPGNDLLIGGEGRDRIFGGDGDAGGDTLVGGGGNDALYGGDGGADSDHLFGGAANDFLDGGLSGNDMLYGGGENDLLHGGTASFEFSSAGVTARLVAENAEPNAHGEGADRLSQVEGLIGSDHADVFTGDDSHGTLRGRGGDDSISGAGGADRIDGGPGSDTLDGGDGIDSLAFGDSPVGVVASLRDGRAEGAGTDAVAGFEQMEGSFFDDELTGDDGPNFIRGWYGANTVFALGGDDDVWMADGGDAGDGRDECMNAFTVSACELVGHFDWDPQPAVEEPVHGAGLDRLDVVRGWGAYGDRVRVFVRRMTAGGCWWWDASRERFVRDVCGTMHANVVPVRQGRWSLPVDVELQPGVYLVGVDQLDRRDEVDCVSAVGPKCVELDVD